MRKFESLNPKELPEHFNVEEHGEQPFVVLNEEKGQIDVSYIFPGFYISDHIRNSGSQDIIFKQINIGGTGSKDGDVHDFMLFYVRKKC